MSGHNHLYGVRISTIEFLRILEACEAAAKAEGFRRLTLLATLPGVPLYEGYGFQELEHRLVKMPDGVTVDAVEMEKPIG